MTENIQINWDNVSLEEKQSVLFQDMLENDELVDVTLANDEMEFPAHKVILASMSEVFRRILQKQKSNTLIYLRGVKSSQLEALISFIYKQEASMPREDLEEFINLATDLKVNRIIDFDKMKDMATDLKVKGITNFDTGKDLLTESTDKVLEKGLRNVDNEHRTFKYEEVKITKMSGEELGENPTASYQPIENMDPGETLQPDHPQTQNDSSVKIDHPEILKVNPSTTLTEEPQDNSPQMKAKKRRKKLKLKPRKMGTRLDLTVGDPITSYEEFKEEVQQYLSRSEDGKGWFCNRDDCSFFAKEKEKVKSHIEIHIRVKLACPFCEKVLHREDYWRRHIYKCHPEEKYNVFPEKRPKARPVEMPKSVVKYW